YYWRMMDLSKNQSIPAGKPVTPNCWSDWAAIDLPLSGDGILEHTIRPTFYNNRLYLCWATRDATPRAGAGTKFLEGNGGNLAMDGTEYY
ncbi:neuraminidase-like domain-containing protein, partial [Xenorhabdus bovienii]